MILRGLAALVLSVVLCAAPALAQQSSPNLVQGQVPTPAQWNSYFAGKLDWNANGLAVNLGGTGSTTSAGARTGLGAAASGANTDITSLGFASFAFPSISGAMQCLHVNSAGVLSGTGSDCGSGSGSVGTTGSPSSGNLTKFSASSTITNADLSGDCTTSGALAVTCLKTNGSAFGTAATQNIGTSGATVPLLNGANLYGGIQNYPSGYIQLLGSSTGYTSLASANAGGANYTATLFAATDQIVGRNTPDTLTNKTLTSATCNGCTLTTPALGTPTSGVATNLTGLPLTTGVSGLLPVGNGGTGDSTFTANAPVIGNGGSALALGSRSGSTTVFGTTSGTLTSGHCVEIDASGNLVDAGGICTTGGGGGTVFSSASNNLAYYASGGTTVSGLTSANSGVLITSGLGVPSISSTLPSGITLVAPALGTPASGTLTNATGLPVSTGISGFGTGVAAALALATTGSGGMVRATSPTIAGTLALSGVTTGLAEQCLQASTSGSVSGAGFSCPNGTNIITPQQYGAACNGSTDDTTALTNWAAALGAGYVGYVPPGNCIFKSPITFPVVNNVTIEGAGHGSILTYAGSTTTGNLLTIGTTVGGGNSCSLENWTIQNITFLSSTVMSSGDALHLSDMCTTHISNIAVGSSLPGNQNFYNGIHFNGGNTARVNGYVFTASNIAEIINGDSTVQWTDMYQTHGVVLNSLIGINIAGNVGGFNLDSSDVLENGTNVLIDQSQTALYNHQIFFGSTVALDITVGGAGYGIDINDAGGGDQSLLFLSGTWIGGATTAHVIINTGDAWQFIMSGGTMYGGAGSSNGLVNNSGSDLINISGTWLAYIGGIALDGTVANTNTYVQGVSFVGNGTNYSSNVFPSSYVNAVSSPGGEGSLQSTRQMYPGTGATGQTGGGWLASTGNPTSGVGNNGDFYMRTDCTHGSSDCIWHKESGSWFDLN